MRQRANSDDRSNALWGRGSRGEARSNALWGRGGRRAGAVVAMAITACAFAAVGTAGSGNGFGKARGNHAGLKSYVEDSLLAAIQQNPKGTFDVIMTGNPKQRSSGLVNSIVADNSGGPDEQFSKGAIRKQFNAINGLQASLTGKVILRLAKRGVVSAILANDTVQKTAVQLPL